MARRLKRNNPEILLYGDPGLPHISADEPPGTIIVNERTGVLYIRRQDMSLMPINAASVSRQGGGTATILSGNTSVVVTHGLDFVPTAAEITITLTENPTNSPGAIWVDTITATQFTVNCEADPGASNLDFAWAVRRL